MKFKKYLKMNDNVISIYLLKWASVNKYFKHLTKNNKKVNQSKLERKNN